MGVESPSVRPKAEEMHTVVHQAIFRHLGPSICHAFVILLTTRTTAATGIPLCALKKRLKPSPTISVIQQVYDLIIRFENITVNLLKRGVFFCNSSKTGKYECQSWQHCYFCQHTYLIMSRKFDFSLTVAVICTPWSMLSSLALI